LTGRGRGFGAEGDTEENGCLELAGVLALAVSDSLRE
jgi:hypothetical protein